MVLTLKVLMWVVIAVVPGGFMLLPLAIRSATKERGDVVVKVVQPRG